MVERRAFGVWMLMMGWKKSEFDLGDVEPQSLMKKWLETMSSRKSMTINDDL